MKLITLTRWSEMDQMHFAYSINIEDIESVTACEATRWGRVNCVLRTKTSVQVSIMEPHDEVLRRIKSAKDSSAADEESAVA